MEKEYKQIEELVARFFEGETSNEEEQIIYQYFTQEDVPEHLRRYTPLFDSFATGITNTFEPPAPVIALPQRKSRRMIWAVGIAASFLILLASGLFFVQKGDSIDPYEGSYIIRNGKKITDLNLIRPELEATLEYVRQQQEETEQLLAYMSEIENESARIKQQIIASNEKIQEEISRTFAEIRSTMEIEMNYNINQ
ncbi:MAG: hypothetical protein LBN11_08180 [Tannerella sp.]|jgi:hypothetical protein|nr:hypothetical protein [Tannerella sp.]